MKLTKRYWVLSFDDNNKMGFFGTDCLDDAEKLYNRLIDWCTQVAIVDGTKTKEYKEFPDLEDI
jgi:hypothetical protein